MGPLTFSSSLEPRRWQGLSTCLQSTPSLRQGSFCLPDALQPGALLTLTRPWALPEQRDPPYWQSLRLKTPLQPILTYLNQTAMLSDWT